MTLRQLFYRVVSAGELANTPKEYKRLGRVLPRLREEEVVERTWLVDHVRSTLKPSSWTGLADFADTVRQAYRKDFWHNLPARVEIFVEKDAIAGTIQPVTEEYDIRLRVCRGYSSVSFAGEIADLWARVRKPIFGYYLGDFDPSGFDLERDLREKLERYSGWLMFPLDEPHPRGRVGSPDVIYWRRLAVDLLDFDEYDLIPLPVKVKDKRAKGFVKAHGDRCAEVDALAPSELRQRVEDAIRSHIPQGAWERLREAEALEQQTLDEFMEHWKT
jgi:hypothetical protein